MLYRTFGLSFTENYFISITVKIMDRSKTTGTQYFNLLVFFFPFALNRTIMALWKARSLSPEQKVQIVEEESETKFLQTEESGSFLGLEDVSMSEIYSYSLSVPVSSLSLSSNCMSLHAYYSYMP